MRRVILIVLDSVGVGAMADAADYGDLGADTLGNTASAVGGLALPNLGSLGLGNLRPVPGVPPVNAPAARHTLLGEASKGKDTVTGHWELAGVISDTPFATFPDGFPPEILDPFRAAAGREILGNIAASGTEILDRLGAEHQATGRPIVYTSADSVFQVAAHNDTIPLEELYRICHAAREILDPHRVARVIARPFIGAPGAWERTYDRKDYAMAPPQPTLLDRIAEAGLPVVGVGKIEDIFSGQGVTESFHTEGNADGLRRTASLLPRTDGGLVFVNLVDFDMLYGHRRDPEGYARALEETDAFLPTLLGDCGDEDLVLFTADHGCDPTFPGHTDHTREHVPLLAWHPGLAGGPAEPQETFAAVAATVADWLEMDWDGPGRSIL
jgi:phosphopentomutase